MAELITVDKFLMPVGKEHYPLHIWSHKPSGFYAKRIEEVTGKPTHSMIATNPLLVASHEWILRERPVSAYTKGKHELWYYTPPIEVLVSDNYNEAREIIQNDIFRDLEVPWWRKRYDWLGILGQKFRVPWLNLPWSWYCSEWTGIVYWQTLLGLCPELWTPEVRVPKDSGDWPFFTPAFQLERVVNMLRGIVVYWKGTKDD